MTRVGYSTEAGLIAKFRIPLDGKTATMFAALVIEHPERALAIEGSFLVMRKPTP